MLGRCGVGASLLASAWMPLMNPGRVTRSDIIFGSWQSMQETGCASPTWPALPASASCVVAVDGDGGTDGGGEGIEARSLAAGADVSLAPLPSGVLNSSACASA